MEMTRHSRDTESTGNIHIFFIPHWTSLCKRNRSLMNDRDFRCPLAASSSAQGLSRFRSYHALVCFSPSFSETLEVQPNNSSARFVSAIRTCSNGRPGVAPNTGATLDPVKHTSYSATVFTVSNFPDPTSIVSPSTFLASADASVLSQ